MTCTSAPMPCWAQKSSISWVRAMPPIIEPAKLHRPLIREKTLTLSGSAGGADVDQGPVDGEQAEVGVEVDGGADGVDDEVEPSCQLLEGGWVGGGEVLVRAKTQPVLLLLQRLRQHRTARAGL